MSHSDIWHGLEREVRADGSRAAFDQARERHEALRAYPDLRTAAAAAARCRCEHRDAIVAALLAEHRATRRSVWSAAAMLAMAPLLASLERLVKSEPSERNDAKSIVATAFLQAVTRTFSADRIAFRIYSQTRRLVLQQRGAHVEHASPHIDRFASAEDVSIEATLDCARFVLRLQAVAPAPDEKPAAYLERVQPSCSRGERHARRELLIHQRAASIAELREAFRTISTTRTEGEHR